GRCDGQRDFPLQRLRPRFLGMGLRLSRPVTGVFPAISHPSRDFHYAAADFFGAKAMGGIYGIILLAWGLAAIPSPIMIAHIHQDLGRYAPAINVIAVVMLIALIFPILARWRPVKPAATIPAVAGPR